jgi:hypothetical protein
MFHVTAVVLHCFGLKMFPNKGGNKVVLGGLGVIMLAIGSDVRGFKPGEGKLIFKGIKIRITTAF